ncbi:uncharacterized protein BDW70DRAFT_155322 [Aspergillus foveolatus]|uniref:uncharacterized protein n=1 Tax=Aspergillus foveolatus TaxID=210207 RepID=UPI003CCD36D6
MVNITVEGLKVKEDTACSSSTTFDLPAETRLADLVPLIRERGYTVPQEFARERDDGSRGINYYPDVQYFLSHPPETLVVSGDCPSNYDERCINVHDTFLHFLSLQAPSKALSARLEGDQKILVDDRLELIFHRTLRMPDDDKIHPLPASRGYFPLYNVEAFASQLPERIRKRGGIFFPMWQREALWIEFNHRGGNTHYAIRVNVGHINAVSGLDIYEVSDKQDYLVVPGQQWFDGISVSPGVVRQFVAMPLGSGYTVEGQVCGKEKFGGIQIEVIPSYKQYTHTFSYSTKQGHVEYAAEHDTPGDHALKDGDKMVMAPQQSTFKGQARLCDFLEDSESFEEIESLHLKGMYIGPTKKSVSRIPYFRSSGLSGYSPFFSMEESHASVYSKPDIPRYHRQMHRSQSVGSDVDLGYEDVADPRRPATRQSSQTMNLREMGIAAGGKLMQDIVQDSSPKGIWDTARAKLLDIHILQPSDFEAVTHIVPPKTPITTEEYIEAGIPFYVVDEDPDQRLDGSATLAGVKSISAMDNEVGVDEADTEFDPLKPKRCATCAVRLCDCIIRPCNHQFCHMCVKAVAPPGKTSHDEQKRCPVCAAVVSHVAGFSAPMNLPGEETFKVDVPVAMLEVQDGRAAFESVVKMRL